MTNVNKPSLKILSYNIHKGFDSGARRFILPRIREVLEVVNADLVFLQEVLGHHHEHSEKVTNWPRSSQFEYLANTLWPHFAYGKNAVYSSGHHGNAILSKFPIIDVENVDVSNNKYERRGLLHATIQVPGVSIPLHAICIHFDLFEKGRASQVERLCDRVKKSVPPDAPIVVGGDFNDWRERLSHIIEERLQLVEVYKELHGKHARTFPSWMPALRLDRIYCRGFRLDHAECLTGKPWSSLSDHAALFANLLFSV